MSHISRRLIALLLLLWAPLSLPLSAQPSAWSAAQIEACAKACGLREGQGCCCSKPGSMGAACPLMGKHHSEPEESEQPEGPSWEKHYLTCGGSEAALSHSRFSKQATIPQTATFFSISPQRESVASEADPSAGPRDDRLGLLPRPPPSLF